MIRTEEISAGRAKNECELFPKGLGPGVKIISICGVFRG